MEKFQELRDIGKNKLHIAEHMLTQTYPQLQEPKLLLAVLENVFLALSNMIGAILYYDRTFKLVPPFSDTLEAKLIIFQTKSMPRHKIDRKFINMIQEIRETLLLHKSSPVEFVRNDKIVICDNDYSMKTVSANKIKDYIILSKEFMAITETITSRNEEIFNKKALR